MNIVLYDNQSSVETMYKRLVEIGTHDAEPYGELDIVKPVLILSGENVESMIDANYIYIEEFRRYYFASIVLGNNGMYTAICEVDPLMSFTDEILNTEVIVIKNEYQVNRYLNDGSYVTEERERTEILNYPRGFNDTGRYILITAGGA